MRIVSCLAVLLAAAGCASNTPKDVASASGASQPAAGAAGSGAAAARTPLASQGAGAGSANAAQSGVPSARVVYFDFDSSEIKQEYVPLVQAHSRYMSSNGSARLRIEGSTDERGSREYNLALGERRAQALKRAMTVLGVPSGRIETVSYGEEKPAAQGHDESAWAKNRRDELVYTPR